MRFQSQPTCPSTERGKRRPGPPGASRVIQRWKRSPQALGSIGETGAVHQAALQTRRAQQAVDVHERLARAEAVVGDGDHRRVALRGQFEQSADRVVERPDARLRLDIPRGGRARRSRRCRETARAGAGCCRGCGNEPSTPTNPSARRPCRRLRPARETPRGCGRLSHAVRPACAADFSRGFCGSIPATPPRLRVRSAGTERTPIRSPARRNPRRQSPSRGAGDTSSASSG